MNSLVQIHIIIHFLEVNIICNFTTQVIFVVSQINFDVMYLCNATKNQRSIHTPAFQYYLLGLPHWLHQRHVALGLKAPIHGNLVQLFHLTAGNLAGFKSTVSFCWGH